ncbi:M20/M25/M40 family metallo-hydrolase [Aurantiacibacter gangjinensis]|uniref:Carboxypeptidase Q n=1 Tax=Aurantiacibacter gangjinensis TaxID=502682 RepID=A0A0G9MR52_9SPHN|nr:M20/M25/M40 family metallo-hydrolase [Aurantiacibacter gangjinensis]APE29084.1 Aminopeptidase [Aurantiacibacter gangjinensis]KLE33175.1 peptidase M28 [Aurantiacibacter gangjinensis]
MHRHLLAAGAAIALTIPAYAFADDHVDALAAQADHALEHDMIAWDFTEGVTTEIGPRQAGTDDEARGRAWAIDWLNANGFANVADEPFQMQTWVRGEERAFVTGRFAQPMHITALGNTASTGPEGIEAEVVYFPFFADLLDAPEGSLEGKIAFISHDMRATQDGSGYGFAGPARWTGPSIAASKGAIATVIRSIGTENHRMPHTGGTTFAEGVVATPAGALTNPDADNLERMFERANGEPITMRLVLTPRWLGETTSGNVVGEVVGRDPSLPPVLLACHLDSWDLGTGAIDDGAGCGIIAAAARHVAEAGQPLRTIRVLFAGAEETGLWGSRAYSEAHIDEPMAVGIESDFGADRIWRFESNFRETNPELHARLARSVARFGVADSTIVARGGADLNIVRDQGGAIIDLQQDGTDYFELHHTPDDTLDKVDPEALRQNVAVWTQVVGILANEAGPISGAE